ncbi:MAG: phosphoserine phosphatase SerB [Desulfobacteraceae bacterium]|nr:phosphoserine phosphatase SerB [Desulfobacteraceae bacterium]
MARESNTIMVTVSGPDRPGILATFCKILIRHRAEIRDIEQMSLRDMLGLYFLLDLQDARDSGDEVIKDLLFAAYQLNLDLRFQPFSPESLPSVGRSNLFIMTHFGDTSVLTQLSKILGDEKVNIENITCHEHHGVRSMDMLLNVDRVSSLSRMKQHLMLKSRELGVNLAIQKMETYRKNKRLIFFDMDSTLLDMEIIDELAGLVGVSREVARVTKKAMRGDFDFEESLVQRVALLKGLTIQDLSGIRSIMKLSEGVEELTTTLKWLGYKMGIISGSFDFFSDHLKERLGFDFAYANQLEIKDGELTGRIIGNVIDAAEKARIVNQSSCDLGIPLDQTVAVGDGANDALMLGQAGLAIAYNAKERLDRIANVALGKSQLHHILHLLGITDEDIDEAMSCRPAMDLGGGDIEY